MCWSGVINDARVVVDLKSVIWACSQAKIENVPKQGKVQKWAWKIGPSTGVNSPGPKMQIGRVLGGSLEQSATTTRA